jgi:ribosome maturation factor RimP
MALDLEGIRQIAARVAASYGLEIWDVELRGTGGKSRMLRVFIDRPRQVGAQPRGEVAASGGPGQEPGSPAVGGVTHPAVGGVTHEDCANVSRELGTILDVEDAVAGGTYLLEVSSPGLDRKLAKAADFERFVGSLVKLMTREPVVLPSGGENRHFEGRLERFGEGKLVLSLEEKKEKGKGQKGKKQRAAGSGQAAGRANHEGLEAAGEGARAAQVEIELSNVERANLVPEI